MNNNSYLVTDAVTDEKLTGRFKLIRHGEKKRQILRGKKTHGITKEWVLLASHIRA